MKIRIADRIITGLTGVLLLAACAGLVAQSFFQVDVIGGKDLGESPHRRCGPGPSAAGLPLPGHSCQAPAEERPVYHAENG